MTAAELKHEISQLRSQAAPLIAQRESYVAQHRAALAADPRRFDPGAVSIAKQRITDTDEMIATYENRIAVLEQRLPSAAEVDAAKEDVQSAAAQCTAATADFEAAWTVLFAKTAAVVEAARRVAATAASVRDARNRAIEMRDNYALDLDVPPPVTPDRHEVTAIASSGRFITDIAYDRIADPLVDRELNAALAAIDARDAEQQLQMQPSD